MPFKMQATLADGSTQEVTVDALPEAVISEAVKGKYIPKDGIEAELNRRVTSIVTNQGLRKPDELLDDEAFVARVLEKHKPKGGAGGDHVDIDVKVAEAVGKKLDGARTEWEAKTLKPLQTQLDGAAKRVTGLERQRLHGQILAAAANVGVKKAFRTPPAPGQPAPIVTMLENLFGLHAETDAYYVREGDGFAFSEKPTKDRPFETIDEFLGKWAATKENVDFLDATRQSGPDLGGGPGTPGGKDVILTMDEASDAAVYAKAAETAAKRGGYVRVKQGQQQQW